LLAWIKGRQLRQIFERANPDVVHSLRIPYEAMMGVVACPQDVPFTVSIWGNDLTLHASTNRAIGHATRRVLAKADMLFADCQRDIDLAHSWGVRPNTPTAVLAGGGGIRLDRLIEARCAVEPRLSDLVGSSHRLIVNARGCREYVRNDVLIEALSLLAPDLDSSVRIIFVDAAHDKALRRSVESYPLARQTVVTGKYSKTEMLSLFCRTEIYVSITAHDGTPNSLLESMAAGAIPVCGDLPSIREWIKHGSNGFLAAYDDPYAVAQAVRLALDLSSADRSAITTKNAQIITARAEQGSTGRLAADNYHRITISREKFRV
jgi:glycosyltransferase involved in cell wall biosynthesis